MTFEVHEALKNRSSWTSTYHCDKCRLWDIYLIASLSFSSAMKTLRQILKKYTDLSYLPSVLTTCPYGACLEQGCSMCRLYKSV